jgi:hypothetical protein
MLCVQLAVGHLRQRSDWIEDFPNGNVMMLKMEDNFARAGSVFKDGSCIMTLV